MSYEKINNFTWVVKDGKKTVRDKMNIYLPKEQERISRKQRITEREKRYRCFLEKIFSTQLFVSKKILSKHIKEEWHANTSWYIKRFVQLGLIKEEYNVIKPGMNL